MTAPLVSVSMVTFNHEAFVEEAARSVLNQSVADLELVVVNDGSTDSTAARLAGIDDPRLVVVNQPNAGPAAATNRAIATCRGEYVALFSGDDVCHPDRLRLQLEEHIRGRGEVIFSICDFIDDEGRPLRGGHFADDAFEPKNESRAATFARLVRSGNYFNGVTAFAKRSVLFENSFDPSLLQLQDFDLWLRLVKKHDLWIMPDQLVRYRIRASGANLSSPSGERLVRVQNEYYLILRQAFDDLPPELFREAFAGELACADFSDGIEYECEKAFAYCRSQIALAQLIGMERLHRLLADPVSAEVLNRRYQYTAQQFFHRLGSVNVTAAYDGRFSTLYADCGNGWVPTENLCRRVNPMIEQFALTFTLPPGIRPRALRWDPMELQTCRVRIDAINLVDAAGETRRVDLATVDSNGFRQTDETVSFPTADPHFWWPVAGEVATVSIHGRWNSDDMLKTNLAQSRHIHEMTADLAAMRRELAAARGAVRAMTASASWRYTAPLRAAKAVARRLRAG
jgi:glycosyltransferase involved in cell wall biosynthesis